MGCWKRRPSLDVMSGGLLTFSTSLATNDCESCEPWLPSPVAGTSGRAAGTPSTLLEAGGLMMLPTGLKDKLC